MKYSFDFSSKQATGRSLPPPAVSGSEIRKICLPDFRFTCDRPDYTLSSCDRKGSR